MVSTDIKGTEDAMLSSFIIAQFKSIDDLERKVDPETRPYDSKYKARELLLEIRDKVASSLVSTEDDKIENTLLKMLGCKIAVRLASNYFTTEETSTSETYLHLVAQICDTNWFNDFKVQEKLGTPVIPDSKVTPFLEALLRDPILLSECVQKYLLLLVYKDLGALWAGRDEGSSIAIKVLERAVELHPGYQEALAKEELGEQNHDADQVIVDKSWDVEANLTYLFFYLGQAWGTKDMFKSARYLMKTLRRQREMNHETYNPITWTRDTLGLSGLFLGQHSFSRALECALAAKTAATEAVSEAKERCSSFSRGELTSIDEGELENKLESSVDAASEVEIQIGRVYSELLGASAAEVAKQGNQLEEEILDTPENESIFGGELVKLPSPLQLRNEEKDKRIEIFKRANCAFQNASKHFVLDGYVSENLNIRMCQSTLYQHLSKFENDPKKIAAMATRRMEFLAGLIDELNPSVYKVELQEVSHELGSAAFMLLDASLQRAKNANSKMDRSELRAGDIKRINSAAVHTIEYFSKFVDFVDPKAENFAENMASTYVLAHANIAHAYNKMYSTDVEQAVAFQAASLKKYEEVLRLYKTLVPADQQPHLELHMQMAQELVELLPAKISAMQQNGPRSVF